MLRSIVEKSNLRPTRKRFRFFKLAFKFNLFVKFSVNIQIIFFIFGHIRGREEKGIGI